MENQSITRVTYLIKCSLFTVSTADWAITHSASGLFFTSLLLRENLLSTFYFSPGAVATTLSSPNFYCSAEISQVFKWDNLLYSLSFQVSACCCLFRIKRNASSWNSKQPHVQIDEILREGVRVEAKYLLKYWLVINGSAFCVAFRPCASVIEKINCSVLELTCHTSHLDTRVDLKVPNVPVAKWQHLHCYTSWMCVLGVLVLNSKYNHARWTAKCIASE